MKYTFIPKSADFHMHMFKTVSPTTLKWAKHATKPNPRYLLTSEAIKTQCGLYWCCFTAYTCSEMMNSLFKFGRMQHQYCMSIYKVVLHDILAVYNKRLLCYVSLGSIMATCADVLNPCKAIFCINRLLLTVQERKPFDFCLCLTSSHAAGSKQALSGIIISRREDCFCFSRPSS